MAQPKKRTADKRVYDLRLTLVGKDPAPWRLVAVSADSTLPALHRTIQGAFNARYVSEHCIVIGGTRYEGGKGSRTLLRRVIHVGDVFDCHDVAEDRHYAAEVVRSYEVPSRRHHPKVLDGAGMPGKSSLGAFDPKVATWCSQDACRGYYPAVESITPPNAPPPKGVGNAISQAQIDELEALLDRCDGEFDSASAVHGFFTAVVSGPMVMPSEWLPIVLGDSQRELSSLDQVRSASGLMMAMYNAVAHELHTNQDDFAILIDRIGDGDDAPECANDWCRGYVRGMALRPEEWQPLLTAPEVRTLLHVIVAIGLRDKDDPLAEALATDAQLYAKALDALAPAAVHLYENWRRRLFPGTTHGTVERAPICRQLVELGDMRRRKNAEKTRRDTRRHDL